MRSVRVDKGVVGPSSGAVEGRRGRAQQGASGVACLVAPDPSRLPVSGLRYSVGEGGA